MKSVDLIERIIINKYCFFTLFSKVENLTMSIIFLVKKIFVKDQSNIKKAFFRQYNVCISHVRNPATKSSRKMSLFVLDGRHTPALRTRLDYQSVGLQLCVYHA